MRGMWRSIGRICEEDKSGTFGKLLRKGIVKHKAIHSTVPCSDRICPGRHFVCLIFAKPLYLDESFRSQLFLGCRFVVFRTGGASQLVQTSIEMNQGGSGIFQVWSSSAARSRMLKYSKVSAAQSVQISIMEWLFLHRLLVRLNVPGYGMPFLDFDPSNNVRLQCISSPAVLQQLQQFAYLAMNL